MNRLIVTLLSALLVSMPCHADLNFDGSTSYVTTYSYAVYDMPDTEGSISLWTFTNSAYTGGADHLMFRAYQLSPLRVFDVYGYNLDGKIYCGWFNNGTEGRYAPDAAASGLTTGRWQHIVVTWANAGNTELWVDGVSRGSGSYVPGSRWDVGAGDGMNIGLWGAAGLAGWVDDVRIYSRILSASEIGLLYSSKTRLNITDGLFAWWKFDDGIDGKYCTPGTQVADYSGNNRPFYCQTTGSNGPLWQSSSWINYP